MSRDRQPLGRFLFLATTVALVAATIATPAPSRAQERPQFQTTVQLVQLQVGVADRAGGFVRGLTPADFVLRVNGSERPVQVAYEVDLRQSQTTSAAVTTAATAGDAVTSEEARRPVAARRHFLLFFDFSFTSRRGVMKAREAAIEFVREQVNADDLLAVATYNRYGMKLLTPFTANHTAALQAVQTLGLVDATDIITGGVAFEESIAQALTELADSPAGGDAGTGEALAAGEYNEYVAQVATYAEQMKALGEMLQAIEGRKHVVLFSRGFSDRVLVGQSLGALGAGAAARAASPEAFSSPDAEMAFGSGEVRATLNEMIETLRNADAVVHAIDPSGLRDSGVNDVSQQVSAVSTTSLAATGGDQSYGSTQDGHQSLLAVTSRTGGTVTWNLPDLGEALARVEELTSAYYVIGYAKAAGDPATVNVEVRMRRPEVQVVSAPTRLTPPPAFADMNAAQRQIQLAEYLADDSDRQDLAFEAQVAPFPGPEGLGRLVVVMAVPGVEIERLASQRGESTVQLEIAGFALDRDNTVIGQFRRGVSVDASRMRAQGDMFEQSVRMSEFVDVPPGVHRLRLLVREAKVGRMSGRTIGFEIPEPTDGMTLGRPLVLANGVAPAPAEPKAGFDPLAFNGRRVVPEAVPVLTSGQTFRLLVVVYGLPRHPVSDEVLAGIVLEVEDSAEGLHRVRDLEVRGSTFDAPSGATQILVEAKMPAGVASGSARLFARIVDSVSGKRIEEQTGLYVRS